MADGLQWLFEIDEKTAGLDTAVKRLEAAEKVMPKVSKETAAVGKAVTAADAEFNKLSATLTQLQRPKQIAELKKQIEEITHPKHEGAFHRLLHAGVEPFAHKLKSVAEFEFIRRGVDAIIEAPQELLHLVTEIGEEALKTAAKTERMDLSFKLQLGQEGAENVLGWVEKIANKTEFTDDKLKVFSGELLRAGVATKDLDRYVAAAGDLAAMGVDAGTAVGALARANLTGNIEGRVLRSLNIPIKDLGQLGQFRGMSEKSIRASLETATIKREDLLRLIAGPDKLLGDKMLEAGKTLEARLTHLKDLPEQFFEKLAHTPAYEVIKDELGHLLEKLDPESPNGRRIFGALENAFNTVGDIMKKFDLAGVIGDAVEAVETLAIEALYLVSIFGNEEQSDKADFVINNMKKRREAKALDLEDRKVLAEKGTTPEFETAADYADLDALEKSGEFGALSAAGALGFDPIQFQHAGEDAGAALVEGARGPKGLDAHSPSRKFEELGEMAADGFERGSGGGDMFAMPAFPSAGGSGPISISFETTISVGTHGGDAHAQGEAAGAAFLASVRPELLRIFEEMQREAGA